MTDAQRKFLHDFLGRDYMLFTAQDKQDLLEAVIRKGEWDAFIVYIDWFSVVNPAYRFTKAQIVSFISWLIQLSPEATAELICKWKGVE